MKKTLFLMATVALMVASCGDNKKTEESSQTAEQPAAEAAAPAQSQETEAITVNLEGTDQMTFNIQEIKAKAGQTINLTLKHVGQMAKTKWDTTSSYLKKELIFLLLVWRLWRLVSKKNISLTMERMLSFILGFLGVENLIPSPSKLLPNLVLTIISAPILDTSP